VRPCHTCRRIGALGDRRGFFDHPRRINAGDLAEKMGMHKTTLLEHIHKAEKRLIGHVLEQVT
jgi:predicted DNA binding protein